MKRIQTLGGLAVFEGVLPLAGSAQQPRRLAVLAVLARGAARGVARDRVAALLWPDTGTERARRSLNQALYALRLELGSDEAILGTRDLRLNPDLVRTDIEEFETAALSGAVEQAARLYGGSFLGDFTLPGAAEFARWADEERDALDTAYRRILEAVARKASDQGDWGGAVLWWRRLAGMDRSSADVAQGLMRALAAAGDIPGAVRHAEVFTSIREQEFELPGDPDVLALAERIRQGELPPRTRRSSPRLSRPDLPPTTPPGPSPDPPPSPGGSSAARPPSIVVLPFINMSPERENEYFSDGLTEELTNALDQVAGLRVASRTSAWAFKGRDMDAREIGARLGVGLLIEGSVRKVGNRIRVTVQVVSAADGYHLWSHAYDRILTDVFALQEEIAHAVVEALARQGYGVGQRRPLRPPTNLVEAYTLYLRGRYHVLKNTGDAMRVAQEYFEQAAELDPGYALAHTGLAHCWAMRGFEEWGDLPPLEAMPRATAALERALAIDPTLADGHALRGIIALLFDYNHSDAEARLARAIELQPSNLLARIWRGILRSRWGYHEEAIAEVLEAEQAEQVISASLRAQFVLGRCYLWAEQFEKAMQRFQAVLELDDSGLALSWIARVHASSGRPDLGLSALETAASRLGRTPMLLAISGGCLAMLGRAAEARAIVGELARLGEDQYVTPVHRAHILALLGDTEAAMECFEEAARMRSGYLALSALGFGGSEISRIPAYQALMARLGLAEPEQLRRTRAGAVPPGS